MREEMQTSQEEFRAVNEELQSANEELQSTNEELTTSREEMQSMNEELQTVNAEQLARLDELAWATSDMNNLLNSTEIATVFLDKGLRVRRFTTGSERIFRLIPADVGRSLTDIASTLIIRNSPTMRARCCGRWSSPKSRSPAATAAGSRCASCRTARRRMSSTAW